MFLQLKKHLARLTQFEMKYLLGRKISTKSKYLVKNSEMRTHWKRSRPFLNWKIRWMIIFKRKKQALILVSGDNKKMVIGLSENWSIIVILFMSSKLHIFQGNNLLLQLFTNNSGQFQGICITADNQTFSDNLLRTQLDKSLSKAELYTKYWLKSG